MWTLLINFMHQIFIRHSLFAELQPKYKEEANDMGPWWRDCSNGFTPFTLEFCSSSPQRSRVYLLIPYIWTWLVMVNKVRWREWYSQPSEGLPVLACSLLHLRHPHERGMPRLARCRVRATWSMAKSSQLVNPKMCKQAPPRSGEPLSVDSSHVK